MRRGRSCIFKNFTEREHKREVKTNREFYKSIGIDGQDFDLTDFLEGAMKKKSNLLGPGNRFGYLYCSSVLNLINRIIPTMHITALTYDHIMTIKVIS